MKKNEFQELLDIHDWWYSSSDDMRVWNRGAEEERIMSLAMSQNDEFYNMYKAKREQIFLQIKKPK